MTTAIALLLPAQDTSCQPVSGKTHLSFASLCLQADSLTLCICPLAMGGWLWGCFSGDWHLASPHATVSFGWSWPGGPLGTPSSLSGEMELFLETSSCLWQMSGERMARAGVCDCVVQACAGNGSARQGSEPAQNFIDFGVSLRKL